MSDKLSSKELSKITYHARNLIPNVIPNPKLAKPKKVSKSKKSLGLWNTNTTSELDRMIRNANQENDVVVNTDEVCEFGRSGRRTKAQIQQDFIAEELRRQEASQRITRQNGHSIIPICECVFHEHNTVALHDTRRQNVRGKRRNICTICELERVTDSELSL